MIARLVSDRRGSPVVEFAMLLPAMLALMMGVGELAYGSYVRAILTGAMQKAARDSGIQGGDTQTATYDAAVLAMVRRVAPNASIAFSTRKSFAQFSYIGTPEPYNDSNKNNICDAGESFTDYNRNGVWDADPGQTGQGGASDATVYTMTLAYPRLFPVAKIVGMSAAGSISSTVILKNQPYANVATDAPPTKQCK